LTAAQAFAVYGNMAKTVFVLHEAAQSFFQLCDRKRFENLMISGMARGLLALFVHPKRGKRLGA
jgi:hypothetical protein